MLQLIRAIHHRSHEAVRSSPLIMLGLFPFVLLTMVLHVVTIALVGTRWAYVELGLAFSLYYGVTNLAYARQHQRR